jgi:hypothetical protein
MLHVGMMNRTLILFPLIFLSIGCSSQSAFNLRLWENGNASNDTRVLQIEEHHACSGNVVLIRTKLMPRPGEGPFEGEKVVELSENNTILRTWYMPVDEIVLGVEDTYIITGFCDGKIALKIGEDGTLNRAPAPKCEDVPINCPEAAKTEIPGSDYLRCWEYRDLRTRQRRLLAYQGPCT